MFNVIYFSPTETTKRVVTIISDTIALNKKERDITLNADKNKLSFNENDFVLLGIPVYSGRVPLLANNIISTMSGKNTPIALVATYGNRDYDDALLELKTIVENNGFLTVAAAAFVTEHSIARKFGAGRPNDDDIGEIRKFAELLSNKLKAWSKTNHIDLTVKGNPEYKEYKTIPIKPHSTAHCIKCGVCSKNCPASAIPLNNPKKTDKNKCVTCVRCIRICPINARCFSRIENFIAEKSLEKLCKEYKYPEIFI